MGAKPSNGFLSEDHFQIETCRWMWNEPGWEKFRRSYLHPANERKIRTKEDQIKANRDKSKGMLPGAYDWIFLMPAFVIELKQPGEKLTADQEKFKLMCDILGIPNYVCEYMEEFQRIVREQFAKVKV